MKFALQSAFISLCLLANCTPEKKEKPLIEERTSVEMVTDKGTMVIALYNETPLHRDNFIKLASEGAFDSLLFHRVIETFMVQGGDPDSRLAQPGDTLGNGGLNYTVDAEFVPTIFHKRGALGAARDGNPARASSSMQFYIVQGKIFNDSLLIAAEVRINKMQAQHHVKQDEANQSLVTALQKAINEEDEISYELYSDSLNRLAENYDNFEPYAIPDEQREVYKSIGGTPHLDQNYTVFGEVVQGLAVVDSIAAVQTTTFDRPVKDVRIQSVRVLE